MGDYYAVHAIDYHLRTFHLDPASFLSPICERLPHGARILDVGCGSGRDLLWLKNRGFNVLGFDRSFQLAALAKKHANCVMIVGDFMVFDFSRFSMDAIVMVGALVHLPRSLFRGALVNIANAVREAGLILLTAKEGKGTETDLHGRTFHYWEDVELRRVLGAEGFRVVHFHRQKSVQNNQDIWLTYVLNKTG